MRDPQVYTPNMAAMDAALNSMASFHELWPLIEALVNKATEIEAKQGHEAYIDLPLPVDLACAIIDAISDNATLETSLELDDGQKLDLRGMAFESLHNSRVVAFGHTKYELERAAK